jgi:hypothetical protein
LVNSGLEPYLIQARKFSLCLATYMRILLHVTIIYGTYSALEYLYATYVCLCNRGT